MILSPKSKIDECMRRGWWGRETLDDVFRRNAARVPQRLAVADAPNRAKVCDGAPRRLSYAELDREVGALAAGLRARGIGRADIVLVQMPNVSEMLVLILACARIGAVVSPVAVQYRENELAWVIDKLAPRAVFTVTRCGDFAMAAMLAGLLRDRPGCALYAWGANLPGGALAAETLLEAGNAPAAPGSAGPPDANDILTICWTSGTEATPKGVPRSHNHWLAIGRVVAAAPRLQDGEVLLGPFPMINMAAIGGVMVPWLLCAGTMVLHHPFELPVFLGQIQQERVNYNLVPPPILNALIRQPEALRQLDISSLRAVCSGSAPLAPWMVRAWQETYGIGIINYFGSNEGVALASSVHDVPDPDERASYFPRYGVAGLTWSAGEAISFETRLREPATGRIIESPGEVGELCIRGATVFEGYFGDDERTRQAFDAEGYFRTGDLFSIAGLGPPYRYYKFCGRNKELVIRGGQNISPAEVDNLIAEHPAVAEVACVGVPDEAMGERLCAVVVLRPGSALTLAGLKEHMQARHVAIFKWPERLVLLPQLPRNPVGKIVRGELRQRVLDRLATGEDA
jgi:acyl-CoA synthetase (AMP-forming)/AMP-acid ligase II